MGRIHLHLTIAWIALVPFCGRTVAANPSNKSFHDPLAAIGTVRGAKEETDRLYKLFEQHAKRIVVADKRQANPKSIPGAYLAKMHSDAWLAERQAHRLAWMGEPAGEDLRIRFEMIQFETNRLCQIYRNSADGKDQAQRAIDLLKSKQASVERIWNHVNSAPDADKLIEIQDDMESMGAELRKSLAFLNRDETMSYWPTYEAALNKLDVVIFRALRKEYDQISKSAIADQLRLWNTFSEESERIRTQIKSSGKASLQPGVEGDAAQAFTHLATRWAHAAAGLNRAIALNWAFSNDPEIVIEQTPLQFHFDVVEELALLVEAGASAPRIDNVAKLYADLLEQITYFDRRCDPRVHFTKKFKFAMNQLANRERNFSRRISEYEFATKHPLDWQRKFVSQQRRIISTDYGSTRKLLYSKQTSDSDRRLLTPTDRGPLVAASNTLIAPASVLVQESAPILVGSRVFGGRLLRLSPNSRSSIVPVRGHAYISSQPLQPTETQLSDLRRMLLVTDQHRPLTIEGADAISSADLLDYQQVGGTIEEIHLESLLTRFITMPDIASVLIPLGESARLTTIVYPRQQICWRLKIKPEWAYNKYFIVRPQSSN